MASSDEHEAMDHAWRYFELHANQRMAVFNFFLVLAGLVAAGLAAAIQGSERLAVLGIVLGLLLALVSFVFWKLDQRVSFLMKHAEVAIAELESRLPTTKTRLFLNELELTAKARTEGRRWARLWTYGQSFRITFWAIGVFGICGSSLSVLRVTGAVQW